MEALGAIVFTFAINPRVCDVETEVSRKLAVVNAKCVAGAGQDDTAVDLEGDPGPVL